MTHPPGTQLEICGRTVWVVHHFKPLPYEEYVKVFSERDLEYARFSTRLTLQPPEYIRLAYWAGDKLQITELQGEDCALITPASKPAAVDNHTL